MKPKPKPMKPCERWAIVDADGTPLWVAQANENSRRVARSRLGLWCHSSIGDRITRVRITEVTRG